MPGFPQSGAGVVGIEASVKKGGGVWVISTWGLYFISSFIYFPADVEEIMPPAREHPHEIMQKKRRRSGLSACARCI